MPEKFESEREENQNNLNDQEKEMKLSWVSTTADKIVNNFPEMEVYTFAAGISPSGIVHFGNFRDVMTSVPLIEELNARGLKTRFLFSWDDYDRFRKVPANVPEYFEEHIGKPLTAVPDPTGETESYARHYQKEFEESMATLGIDLEYHYQTEEYKSGRYNELILVAIEHRKEIAEILLSLMSDKAKGEKGIDEVRYIEEYYPLSVYSRFTNKDNTKVLGCDGYNVTYHCNDTGKEETVDLRESKNVKLQWKVDWPMRWKAEGVVFEPGGHDHASPGGSFDAASKIARKVFGIEPPVFVGYEFIGLRGLEGKMSGSSGLAVSPAELLKIYEPELLKWLYLRKSPSQTFQLAFDTEIYRQYDEYDKEFDIAGRNMPFRQAVAFGDILQWDLGKVVDLLKRVGLNYDETSVANRLEKAKFWLERYNQSEMIHVREEINNEYLKNMKEEQKIPVRKIREYISQKDELSLEELTETLYNIPKIANQIGEKELKIKQKNFYKDLYNLLISADRGPRLATFLCALDKEKILKLLDI